MFSAGDRGNSSPQTEEVHVSQGKSQETPGHIEHEEKKDVPLKKEFDSRAVLNDLKKHSRKLAIRRLFYPNIPILLKDHYINLSILRDKDYECKLSELKEVKLSENPDETLDTYSNLYGQTDHIIGPDDLMEHYPTPTLLKKNKVQQKINSKKILIVGTAGIGKSTLSGYISCLWATEGKKGYKEYDWVFQIALRNLSSENYPKENLYTPMSIIINENLKEMNSYKALTLPEVKKLESELIDIEKVGKVLLILDGYDEIAENLPNYLVDILKNFLSMRNVIVTSRPYNLYGIKEKYHFDYQLKLEITGFTHDNIRLYVDKFFKHLETPRPEKVMSLVDFIQRNPSIAGTCRIPINLELVCSTWEQDPFQENTPLSMSKLYEKVTISLCMRYLEKKKERKKSVRNFVESDAFEKCADEIGFLEYLAYQSALHRKLFIKLDATKRYFLNQIKKQEKKGEEVSWDDIFTQQEAISFIKPNNSTGKFDGQSDYYFNHLTFRDFFAARYLSVHLVSLFSKYKEKNALHFLHEWDHPDKIGVIEFIRQKKFSADFEFIWWFVAGILANRGEAEALKNFLSILLDEPKDMLGLFTTNLLIRCLDEAGETSRGIKNLGKFFIQITAWINLSFQFDPIKESLYSRLKLSQWLFRQPEIERIFISRIEEISGEDEKKESKESQKEINLFPTLNALTKIGHLTNSIGCALLKCLASRHRSDQVRKKIFLFIQSRNFLPLWKPFLYERIKENRLDPHLITTALTFLSAELTSYVGQDHDDLFNRIKLLLEVLETQKYNALIKRESISVLFVLVTFLAKIGGGRFVPLNMGTDDISRILGVLRTIIEQSQDIDMKMQVIETYGSLLILNKVICERNKHIASHETDGHIAFLIHLMKTDKIDTKLKITLAYVILDLLVDPENLLAVIKKEKFKEKLSQEFLIKGMNPRIGLAMVNLFLKLDTLSNEEKEKKKTKRTFEEDDDIPDFEDDRVRLPAFVKGIARESKDDLCLPKSFGKKEKESKAGILSSGQSSSAFFDREKWREDHEWAASFLLSSVMTLQQEEVRYFAMERILKILKEKFDTDNAGTLSDSDMSENIVRYLLEIFSNEKNPYKIRARALTLLIKSNYQFDETPIIPSNQLTLPFEVKKRTSAENVGRSQHTVNVKIVADFLLYSVTLTSEGYEENFRQNLFLPDLRNSCDPFELSSRLIKKTPKFIDRLVEKLEEPLVSNNQKKLIYSAFSAFFNFSGQEVSKQDNINFQNKIMEGDFFKNKLILLEFFFFLLGYLRDRPFDPYMYRFSAMYEALSRNRVGNFPEQIVSIATGLFLKEEDPRIKQMAALILLSRGVPTNRADVLSTYILDVPYANSLFEGDIHALSFRFDPINEKTAESIELGNQKVNISRLVPLLTSCVTSRLIEKFLDEKNPTAQHNLLGVIVFRALQHGKAIFCKNSREIFFYENNEGYISRPLKFLASADLTHHIKKVFEDQTGEHLPARITLSALPSPGPYSEEVKASKASYSVPGLIDLSDSPFESIMLFLKSNMCTCLKLSNCRINDDDLKQIVSMLEKNKSLVMLDLSNNLITDRGFEHLFKLLEMLSHLDLSHNFITDQGLHALFESNVTSDVLLTLNLQFNFIHFGNETFKALRNKAEEHFPNAIINVSGNFIRKNVDDRELKGQISSSSTTAVSFLSKCKIETERKTRPQDPDEKKMSRNFSESITFSTEKCVLALVVKKSMSMDDHALIIIEKMSISGQISLNVCELLVKECKKKARIGGSEESHPAKLRKRIDGRYKCFAWTISKKEAEVLERFINEDRNKPDIDYFISGSRPLGYQNCITWAADKLNDVLKLGIDVSGWGLVAIPSQTRVKSNEEKKEEVKKSWCPSGCVIS